MKRNLSGKDLNKPGRKEDKPDVSVRSEAKLSAAPARRAAAG